MRLALNAKTTWTTLPQIYINSDFVGGCIDIFDECEDGELQERLKASNIPFNASVKTDPLSFLPSWLHPR